MTVNESFNPWLKDSSLYKKMRLNSCLFLEEATRRVQRQEMSRERGMETTVENTQEERQRRSQQSHRKSNTESKKSTQNK